MNKYLGTVLKPIFKVLAAPGINNPHTPYENELMLAGSKPVAVMLQEDISLELKRAVQEGKIVEIDRTTTHRDYNFYYLSTYQEEAEKAINIFEKKTSYSLELSAKERNFLNEFLEAPVGENSQKLSSLFNERLKKENLKELLLNGEINSIDPLRCPQSDDLSSLNKAVASEYIKVKNIKVFSVISTLAQKNRIEEGKEVHSRVFSKKHDYPTINTKKEWDTRIGTLLGYTTNDIAYCNEEKYTKIKRLMKLTNGMRKKARLYLSLDK